MYLSVTSTDKTKTKFPKKGKHRKKAEPERSPGIKKAKAPAGTLASKIQLRNLRLLHMMTVYQEMHPDTGCITQGDGRGPFEMAKKGVLATGLTHQGNASR